MRKIAVVYHSGHGHTEHFAKSVVDGVKCVGAVAAVEVRLIKAEPLTNSSS